MTMKMGAITQAQLTQAAQLERSMRQPKFPFHIYTQPYHIMPMMIAPVLPGETLVNLSLQARVVTDPIKSPIIGWHKEYCFFYVKLTDLFESVAQEMPKMLTDVAWAGQATVTAQAGGTATQKSHFFASGATQFNYVELCRQMVVRHYFRDEKDDYNTNVVAGHPVAQFLNKNVLDSVENAADVTSADIEVEGADANTTIQMSEILAAMEKWELLRANSLMELTFPQFLEAWGIRQPTVELHEPELLRYVRDWQYPSNTIDPTNGAPRSAVSWSIQAQANKHRFFKEHGFIVGYSITRPKVYLRLQKGTFTSQMNDWKSWLPPWGMKDPSSYFKLTPDNQGPLPDASDTGGYHWDVKDLLMYGEQFVNRDMDVVTDMNLMARPGSTLGSTCRYPGVSADIEDNLFVTPLTAKYVKQDGIVSLKLLSRSAAVDTSPRGGQVLQLLG